MVSGVVDQREFGVLSITLVEVTTYMEEDRQRARWESQFTCLGRKTDKFGTFTVYVSSLRQRDKGERQEEALYCPLPTIFPHSSGKLRIWSLSSKILHLPQSSLLSQSPSSALRVFIIEADATTVPTPPPPALTCPLLPILALSLRSQESGRRGIFDATLILDLCPAHSLSFEPQGSALYSLEREDI